MNDHVIRLVEFFGVRHDVPHHTLPFPGLVFLTICAVRSILSRGRNFARALEHLLENVCGSGLDAWTLQSELEEFAASSIYRDSGIGAPWHDFGGIEVMSQLQCCFCSSHPCAKSWIIFSFSSGCVPFSQYLPTHGVWLACATCWPSSTGDREGLVVDHVRVCGVLATFWLARGGENMWP